MNIRHSLRRTLVLVNGEWSMVNKDVALIIDHSPLPIHSLTAQVSDTTGDAIRTIAGNIKILNFLYGIQVRLMMVTFAG